MAEVYLATDGNAQAAPVTSGRARLQRLAKHWHFVMRSRRRWIGNPELEQEIHDRAVRHLEAIGIKADTIERMAASGIVQVSVEESPQSTPTTSSDTGWEGRLIPWEYLLSAATQKYRKRPLVVVRHLRGLTWQRPVGSPVEALFVQSAPGTLSDVYDFNIERRVLEKHLGDEIAWKQLEDPTLELIKQGVQPSPHIVHVSGLDNYQGARELDPDQTKITPASIKDGMYLRDDKWNPTP